MRKVPDEDVMETLFLKQVRKSNSMQVELAYYERAEVGSKERSYAFLLSAVKRMIQQNRQKQNRKEIETALGQLGNGNNPRALAAKGGGKAKGGGAEQKICFNFRDTRTCDRQNCPYKHGENAAPAKGKGKRGRSNSPFRKGKGKGRNRSSSKGRGKGKRSRSRERRSSGSLLVFQTGDLQQRK